MRHNYILSAFPCLFPALLIELDNISGEFSINSAGKEHKNLKNMYSFDLFYFLEALNTRKPGNIVNILKSLNKNVLDLRLLKHLYWNQRAAVRVEEPQTA